MVSFLEASRTGAAGGLEAFTLQWGRYVNRELSIYFCPVFEALLPTSSAVSFYVNSAPGTLACHFLFSPFRPWAWRWWTFWRSSLEFYEKELLEVLSEFILWLHVAPCLYFSKRELKSSLTRTHKSESFSRGSRRQSVHQTALHRISFCLTIRFIGSIHKTDPASHWHSPDGPESQHLELGH